MSRIGKRPVTIPKGTSAKLDGNKIMAKGPKGELSMELPLTVSAKIEADKIVISKKLKDSNSSTWGATRANLQNLINGVTTGFERRLEITGVGYRASVSGKKLQLALGYSHEINYPIPAGVTVTTPKPVEIIVTGADRRLVGDVASEIRRYRPPEPYQGKGVKYLNEYVQRKEGKKK